MFNKTQDTLLCYLTFFFLRGWPHMHTSLTFVKRMIIQIQVRVCVMSAFRSVNKFMTDKISGYSKYRPNLYTSYLLSVLFPSGRSQWPSGLRRGSAADRLLGHGCLSVGSVVCCQVEVSATGRSLV